MEKKSIDQMTIEELLAKAGNPRITINTYLYLAQDGHIRAMEKGDREASPIDEDQLIGYVSKFIRATGGTGAAWHMYADKR